MIVERFEHAEAGRSKREEKGEDAVVFERDKISETITGAMANYGFAVPTGGYDNQNRLTAWNRTDGARNQTWALSAVGDWNTFTDAGVAQTRTHGPAHEILTMAAATVTHDSRGNMTVDEQAKAFTWDTSNMLKQAVVPAGSSTGTAGTHLYKYDALGRRIAKTTDSTGTPFTTVYIHVGSQVYAEYQASQLYSNPLRKYTYGPDIDEPVLLIDRTAAGSVGAGTDERFYYHLNQQYSITALCDNTGAVVERYAYTAYGEPMILDGAGTTVRTASFVGNPYLYTARAYDAETGLYYFRARMYEGRKGRFLSHDPIMYPDGANTYAGWFAAKKRDPMGLDVWSRGGDDEKRTYETARINIEIQKQSDCKEECGICSGTMKFFIHYHALVGGQGLGPQGPSYGLCLDGEFTRFDVTKAGQRGDYPYYYGLKKTIPIGSVPCSGGSINARVTVSLRSSCESGNPDDGRIAEVIDVRVSVMKCGKGSASTSFTEVPLPGKHINPPRCVSCFEEPYPPYDPKNFPDE